MHLDMHYLTEVIAAKKNGQFFETRHAGGYFDRVWGVHPLADRAGKKSRRIEIIDFSPRQRVIEGVSESLPLPRFLLPLNLLLSQLRLLFILIGIVRRQRIDVIGATDPFYLGLIGVALKKLCRRPLVVHIYANFDDTYEDTGRTTNPRLIPFRWLEKAIGRFVLRRTDLVIAPNRNNLGWALSNGARCDTAIVSNARYVQDIHLRAPDARTRGGEVLAAIGVERGRPVLLTISRLVDCKRPEDAVLAMALAIRERPRAIGLIAGRGPMEEELRRLIVDLGMEQSVRLVGFVDQKTLSELIPHTITVSPLTGMALIESALGASPIVAYDRDWQADFVEDRVSGFIVPFRDVAAMAKRIVELIDDPQKARRFGAAIRERALELSDRSRIYAAERTAMERLLQRHDEPGGREQNRAPSGATGAGRGKNEP